MAVTIHQNPSRDINLSGNPIVWTFSSNQTAQPNFSYVVEVYVNSVLHSTHQVFPESGIFSYFDCSEIAESVLGVPNIPSAITVINGGSVEIYIKVFERHGVVPKLYDSSISSTAEVIKGKQFLNIWIVNPVNNYYDVDFLTDSPKLDLRNGESIYLSTANSANSFFFVLEFFDSSGTALHIESTPSPIFSFELKTFRLKWSTLNSYYPLAGVDKVVVSLLDGVGGKYAEKSLDIIHCKKPYSKRLHFLNQLGGIDSFTFDQVGRKSSKNEANSFKTNAGQLVNNVFKWNLLNSQVSNFQVTTERKITIESGWISEDVQEWLNDNLFTSPAVWLETPYGLQRVANMNSNVTYNRHKEDMLFNTTIEIDELHHSSMIV